MYDKPGLWPDNETVESESRYAIATSDMTQPDLADLSNYTAEKPQLYILSNVFELTLGDVEVTEKNQLLSISQWQQIQCIHIYYHLAAHIPNG